MNNGVTKKDIKNYSRDFRTIANRTLNSDFDVFDGNLKRLINYIDNNSIISEFINSCIDDEDEFYIEDDLKQVSNGYGRYYFHSFIEERKEISYTYQKFYIFINKMHKIYYNCYSGNFLNIDFFGI